MAVGHILVEWKEKIRRTSIHKWREITCGVKTVILRVFQRNKRVLDKKLNKKRGMIYTKPWAGLLKGATESKTSSKLNHQFFNFNSIYSHLSRQACFEGEYFPVWFWNEPSFPKSKIACDDLVLHVNYTKMCGRERTRTKSDWSDLEQQWCAESILSADGHVWLSKVVIRFLNKIPNVGLRRGARTVCGDVIISKTVITCKKNSR